MSLINVPLPRIRGHCSLKPCEKLGGSRPAGLDYLSNNIFHNCYLGNIVHRDIKPENVLLFNTDDLNPIVTITDMGLSKDVEMSEVKTSLKDYF
jgi:serine/threonine protein kinase